MITGFILIAGSLAAGTALLLLRPLVRRRDDGRPVAIPAALVLAFVLLAGGATLYTAFSNYTWQAGASSAESPAAMTARLAKRLARGSGTIDEWLQLGRSYAVLEQFPLAIRAYQRADQLAGGQNAEAVLGIAEVLVAQNVEELRGRGGRLAERALALDPASRKALFYSAFAALGRGEPALARGRIQQLLANEDSPDVRALLERGLQSADQLEGQADQTSSSPQPAQDAKIMVRVTVAPALAGRLPPGAPLFVMARDPKAPGPPFAVKRLAATFPVDVELSAADAMLESRRIAAGQQLEVVARVALGGTPTASSGDPFGQVGYHVGKDGKLNIVIDRLSP
jgi:cytochrome c-type biogenesis protein CcmH